jgi:hypothetical protein
LPQILETQSDYFLIENCKFANEKPKRNCARLAYLRDFNLLDSYTIEASCFGYKVKGTGTGEEGDEEPEIIQFTPTHFLEFGRSLL